MSPIRIAPRLSVDPRLRCGGALASSGATPLARALLLSAAMALAACGSDADDGTSSEEPDPPNGSETGVPTHTYSIVNAYPHDPEAFTQGLLYHDGFLYEGTGLPGRSSLRQVELETGDVVHQRLLADQYFGEGIALVDGRIVQLTYRSHVAFSYALGDFQPLGEFAYPTQGWGLAYDGQRLLMTDGSSTLYFRDADTFEEIGKVTVRHNGRALSNLNELEIIRGEVWANIWQTDVIARISPASGKVTGLVNLAGLLTPQEQARADVLNGIAYDAAGSRIFVTGKLWPWLFEIRLETP